MSRSFYKYKVTWFDEYCEEEPWRETVTEGLLVADSFYDASEQLEKCIFDNIAQIELTAINDSEALDFEDLLLFLNPDYNKGSAIGPQIIQALKDAVEATNYGMETDN